MVMFTERDYLAFDSKFICWHFIAAPAAYHHQPAVAVHSAPAYHHQPAVAVHAAPAYQAYHAPAAPAYQAYHAPAAVQHGKKHL